MSGPALPWLIPGLGVFSKGVFINSAGNLVGVLRHQYPACWRSHGSSSLVNSWSSTQVPSCGSQLILPSMHKCICDGSKALSQDHNPYGMSSNGHTCCISVSCQTSGGLVLAAYVQHWACMALRSFAASLAGAARGGVCKSQLHACPLHAGCISAQATGM